MAIVNGYTTLADLKARLFATDTNLLAATTYDTALERIIEAVSRLIDANRGRRFYTVSETRTYRAGFSWMVEIDDLVSLTSLKTDTANDGTFLTLWAAADYRLAPHNATVNGEPYTWIETRPGGAYAFPGSIRGAYYDIVINTNYDYPRPAAAPLVQVTGAFGYSATAPAAITEACILGSMRVWKRKDLTFGIVGSAELGTQIAVSPLLKDGEFMALLQTIPKKVVV